MGLLFALVVTRTHLPSFATGARSRSLGARVRLKLAVAGRHKALFLGLAMRFVNRMPFMSTC